jgi:hydroxyacylglutathione hydrolase
MDRAIRLSQSVYLAGSGEIGLTEEHDSHVYLMDTGASWVAVDAGAGIDPMKLVEIIGSLAEPKHRLSHLLLTHCHADHAGGAAYLQEHFGIKVMAGNLTSERVQRGDDAPLALDIARAEGIYPADYVFRPPQSVQPLSHGEEVSIGDLKLAALDTPGHSADSVCYLAHFPEGRALFCGDSLFANGLLPLLNTIDSSLTDYRSTIRLLAGISFEMLLPGHGLFLLRGGSQLVSQLSEKLAGSIYIPSIIAP